MNKKMTTTRSIAPRHAAPLRAKPRAPVLKHGEKLDADEFLRRYELMDENEKAELINGVVYMFTQFVTIQWHGIPDSLLQFWLSSYAFETAIVQASANTTVKLGIKNVPQPDGLLRLLPEFGGGTHVDERGCLVGRLEFAAEIAASTTAFDLGKKMDAYRDNGVQEYLVWGTKKDTLNWWYLEDGKYVPILPDVSGIMKSRVFPGLWLDAKAMLTRDSKGVIAALKKGMKSAEYKKFLKRK